MHKRRVFAAGLVLLTAVAAGAELISAKALSEAGLQRFWELRLTLEKNQVVEDAYLVDDALYVCTNDGYVFAIHAPTGAVRWLRQVTDHGYRLKRPCHNGDTVIFATPVDVRIYDRRTGEGVFRAELRFPCSTRPVCNSGRLYLGGFNERFYAFEQDQLYNEWKAMSDRPVVDLTLHDDVLYVVTQTGRLYAADPLTKVAKWQEFPQTRGFVSAPLAVDPTGVYVAARDRSLWCFNRVSGELEWETRLSAPLYDAPVLMAGRAYQFSPVDGLVSIDVRGQTQEQRVLWNLTEGYQLASADDEHLYVLSRYSQLLVVDPTDGQVRHRIPAPGFTIATTNVEQPAIYLAGRDGRVFCARKQGVPIVTRRDVLESVTPPALEDELPEVPPTPAVVGDVPDALRSGAQGPPLGGKSEISRNWGTEEEADE